MSMTGQWAGLVLGTNAGFVVVQIQQDGQNLAGHFALYEEGFRTIARVNGIVGQGGKVVLHLSRFEVTPATQAAVPQNGQIEGNLDAARGVLEGEWRTDAGTHGRFILARAPSQLTPSQPQPLSPQLPPPPLITKTVVLGSYRYDSEDLKRITEVLKAGTNITLPMLTAQTAGRSFIHLGVESLLSDANVPSVLYEMVISANEPAVNMGTRTVTLTFTKAQNQQNTLFVSGYDRTWVEGKAAEVEACLKEHESKTAAFLKKQGPNLNGALFLLMLGFLPSIPSLENRFRVIAAVFALLLLLLYSWRLAVNTKIYLRTPKLAWHEKHENLWITILGVLLSGLIAYLLQKYVHP
jgi:hypothetical protein